MAIEHNTITDPEIHEPKDISTATLGQVYVAIGGGTGVWATLAGDNLKLVNDITDFPAAVAGVITLLDNINYVLTAPISTADRFIAGDGSSITSNSILGPRLTYTGTGSMFTGVDTDFLVTDIELDCPNGQVFEFSETGGGGLKKFLHESVVVISCVKYGTFDTLQACIINNSSCLDCDDGLDFSGSTWVIISLVKFALVSSSATFLGVDLGTAVSPTIELTNLLLAGPAGATGLDGATSNGNVPTGSVATLTSSSFIGFTTPIVDIDVVDDIRWFSSLNSANIQDTMPDAMASLTSNATNTVISGAGTAVLVAGTWTDERSSHYTVTTAGRITYIGEKDLVTPVDIIVEMEPVSGTNKNLSVQLFKNGSFVTGTKMKALTASGDPLIFSTMWQLVLSTNDFLEVFVSNETDAININVNDAIFRVR